MVADRSGGQAKLKIVGKGEQLSGPGPGGPSDGNESMSDRVSKLEGIVGGIQHVQTNLLVAIGIVVAFVVGFGFYTLARIDSVSDRVNSLPAQISSEMRDITRTLAESITATKQQVPQVIVLPERNLEKKK